MSIRIDGTNTTANPGITGSDTDTGLQFGTNEVKIVTDGSDRVTVDSSGNVGIATSTISGANLVIETNSNSGSGIKLIGKSANGGAEVDFRNNADDTLNGFIEFNDNGGILSTAINQPQVFRTNNTERMRILSGGGLTFNGDTAAANALDDYEEGTWTPTFTASTTNPVYSTNTAAGHYTKIGNTVTAWGLIIVDGVTSNGSGNWRISSFPFNSSGQLYSQVGTIGYNDVPTNEVNKIYMVGSYAQIIPNGVTQSNETYNSNALTTGYFSFTITYRTT